MVSVGILRMYLRTRRELKMVSKFRAFEDGFFYQTSRD
jgi:hypothetical protein